MRVLHKVSLAVGLMIGFGATALAADMPSARKVAPVPAVYNWSGFYAGVNAGYGWGKASGNAPLVGPISLSASTSGALVGGQLGYNWQAGSTVFGLETDIDWADVKGSTSTSLCTGVTCTATNTWLGTTRGRIGGAFDRWMPYATGGLAYGGIKATNVPAALVFNGTQTKVGWTAGAGVEAALSANWTAKAEYLYVDLGTSKFACTPACGTVAIKVHENVVRGGINYRF